MISLFKDDSITYVYVAKEARRALTVYVSVYHMLSTITTDRCWLPYTVRIVGVIRSTVWLYKHAYVA